MNLPNKRIMLIILLIFVFIIASVVVFISACDDKSEKEKKLCSATNCTYYKIENSNYCHRHTCPLSECNHYKDSKADYCTYHSTTPISGITVVSQSVDIEYKSQFRQRYVFRVKFSSFPKGNNIAYAVLTFYNSNNIAIHREYTATFGATDCSITFISSELPNYDHYEWELLLSKPSKLGKL